MQPQHPKSEPTKQVELETFHRRDPSMQGCNQRQVWGESKWIMKPVNNP